jgi:nuclear pore complex protein Nup155
MLEQLNGAAAKIQIGLFAELHHAWAIVDNILYLWDYTHPNPELSGYDELSSAINVVRLAKPKPGVFRSEVTHVILIATVREVVILGLTASTSPAGVTSVTLYQTDLKLPMNGPNPTCLAASAKTGRVFFGCDNSDDIFEITYQNEEKWFSSKCGKINHTAKDVLETISPGAIWNRLTSSQADAQYSVQMEVDDTRDLLFAISSTSTIRVFHIKPGDVLKLIIVKKWDDIMGNIAHMPQSSAQSRLLGGKQRIASISTIPDNESTRLALMATTVTGVRIYFSMTSGGFYFGENTSVPSSMQVHHIKFPPPPQAASSTTTANGMGPNQAGGFGVGVSVDTQSLALNPTQMSRRYSPGFYFDVVRGSTSDTIFMTAPDSARLARPAPTGPPRFSESGQWLSFGNAQVADIGLVTPPFKSFNTPSGFGNELAVQFDQPVTEIAIITNMGIHVLKRNRLVDIFSSVLRSCNSEEEFEEFIKKFVRLYGRTETCACALAVACGQAFDTNVANDPVVVDLARRIFIEHGGKPDIQEVLDNSHSQIDNVRPSPRAQALVLYTSRLIRSAWNSLIMREQATPVGGVVITPTVPIKKLQEISQSLMNLQEFLEANKNAIPGLSGPEEMSKAASIPEQLALQAEHRAMDAHARLIRNAVEGIAFLIQLFEHPVHEILLSLQEAERTSFKALTYESLFTTERGKLLAKEVVKAIVSRSIAEGSNVDTVADNLRRRCGSFCSADDVVIFKAQEQLQKAINIGSDTATGRNLLNESLRLFEKVAGSLSNQYLEAAIRQYVDMSFFAGKLFGKVSRSES